LWPICISAGVAAMAAAVVADTVADTGAGSWVEVSAGGDMAAAMEAAMAEVMAAGDMVEAMAARAATAMATIITMMTTGSRNPATRPKVLIWPAGPEKAIPRNRPGKPGRAGKDVDNGSGFSRLP